MHKIGNTEIEITKGDITSLGVDAIVNAANNYLIHGGGLAGTIVKRGGHIIQQESKKIGNVPTGGAVITSGGKLKAKHVIHAVGPKYKDGKSGECEKLDSAVKSALDIASKKKLKSVALPAISAGSYGYPAEENAKVITNAIIDYLKKAEQDKTDLTLERIIVCLYDDESFKHFEKQFNNYFKK